MKPIDTKTWKEFKISDLFEIENGKYVDPKTLTIDDNGSPYLRASIFNNGQDVDKYTGEGFKTKPNIISWGKQSPFFSYHTKACYTGQGIYWFKFDKGQNVAHFICTVLQRVGKNYNYQNCLTGAKLKHETIQLPVDQTGQPDWDYMEAFMEQINQQAQARLDEYKEGKLEYTTLDSKIGYTPVDTESWAEFEVGDLFEKVSRGTRLKKTDRTPGDKPLLTAGGYNNGVAEYIEKHDKLYTGKNLTIDMFGNSFVHTYPFYADDNILIFETKKYTENQLLFIKTALTHLKTQYGFQKQYRLNSVETTRVTLPVDQTGQPDWNYMESFMKQINQQAQTKLSTLEKGNI